MTTTTDIGPFSIAPLWVLERLVGIDQTEALRLYVGLSKWTNGNDRDCHPSRKTVADYIGCSTKTIDRYIAALVDVGALEVTHRHTDQGDMTSSNYRLLTSLPRDTYVQTPLDTDVHTRRDTDVARSRPSSKQTQIDPNVSSSELSLSLLTYEPFDEFWSIYGNLAGSGKKKSRECWDAAMKRGDDPELILEGLRAWVVYWRTPDASKAMYAQGFLNQGKWETPPPPVRDEQQRKVMPGRGGIEAALAARSQRGIGTGS